MKHGVTGDDPRRQELGVAPAVDVLDVCPKAEADGHQHDEGLDGDAADLHLPRS